MKKITTLTDLKNSILQLEEKQAKEYSLLKEQFLTTYESLKPLNVIKNTIKEFTSSPDIKDNLLGASVGLTTGFISKALLVGVSHNPVKNILGTLLQFGIANIVAKNPQTIKSLTSAIINLFSKKKEANEQDINGHSL